jgi:AcrR family transcriptional regulator
LTEEAPRERVARRPADKYGERRDQLAAAALQTLAEQGYARTSLRDIAQNSEFSHGVLHYYFQDKADLMTYCVRRYKAECVTRYDSIMATATTPEELLDGIGAAMMATLREDAAMHRLWYDLRNQSQFEGAFRDGVLEIDQSLELMIWRLATRYAELAKGSPTITRGTAYALMDGLFQHALIRHLWGDEDAAAALEQGVRGFMASLVRT